MGKFYLKQIIVTTDEKVADEAKYVFNDLNSALVRFHSLMASNMNEPKVANCTLMIVVDNGKDDLYVERSETFRRANEPQAE